MAYLGSWKIDDWLTFYCNTHRADTGAATDADAVPTYRVYEDETGTAILTGSMAKLDDANTTGFYSERIQLLAATGFEKGKQYVVYISATVDSDTGTMHHTWQMEAEVDANTVSGTVTPADDSITAAKIAADAVAEIWGYSSRTLTQSAASVTAAVSGSTITLNRGDTLSAALTGLGSLSGYVSLDFTVKYAKSDTDDNAVMRIRKNASGTGDGLLRFNGAVTTGRETNGSITIDDASAGNITIALAAAESDDLAAGSYYYDIQMITASAVSTLSEATFTVTEDVTRLIT